MHLAAPRGAAAAAAAAEGPLRPPRRRPRPHPQRRRALLLELPVLLSLLLVVLLVGCSAAAAPPAGGEAAPRDLVVGLAHARLAERLRPLCSSQARRSWRERLAEGGDRGGGAGRAAAPEAPEPELPAACEAALSGTCRHAFSSALPGLAGRFSRRQVAELERCVRQAGSRIEFVEEDGAVAKAERGEYSQWWRHRAPAGVGVAQLLQQLRNGSRGSSGAKGVRPSEGQVWRWLLADLGLSAQRQLARAAAPARVAAADGPAAAMTAEGEPRSAGEGGDGGGPSGDEGAAASTTARRGSKNQDPGLPVDASAFASPQLVQQQQPLSSEAAQAATREPGAKVQALVKALWALDRVDQRALPLNGSYVFGAANTTGTGKGVTIYTLDSGIRASHQEFMPWGGGESRAVAGPDFVDDDGSPADDCDGHGTHVSSTAAGRSVGVAKGASVVAVRVLDCAGAGAVSDVVAGLDWVQENARRPAVASLSLGVPSGQWSRALEAAVDGLVGAGIPVVVAAGNSAADSCGVAPARVPSAITVAASNLATKFDGPRSDGPESLYRWTNTGPCVDLIAPGVDIYGACGGPSRCESVDDHSYSWSSGTSMAAPAVAGAAAVYLEANPGASPAEVAAALVGGATAGALPGGMPQGTPNLLLFTRGAVGGGQGS